MERHEVEKPQEGRQSRERQANLDGSDTLKWTEPVVCARLPTTRGADETKVTSLPLREKTLKGSKAQESHALESA
jgi:hypothetical protein